MEVCMRLSAATMCPAGRMVDLQTYQEFARQSMSARVGYVCWLHGELQGYRAGYCTYWPQTLDEHHTERQREYYGLRTMYYGNILSPTYEEYT